METAVQEETKLPIADPASAHSTPQENPEEETGEEVEQVVADASDESDAEQGPRKPKRQRLVLPESSSTEDEQGDTGNSGIPSPAKSHPLTVSPLASRPPAISSNTSRLGVFSLGDEPDSDEEDEPRFALWSIPLFVAAPLWFLFFDWPCFCFMIPVANRHLHLQSRIRRLCRGHLFLHKQHKALFLKRPRTQLS